ncbi:DUF934 domain-containing protein [Tianweitania sp.]|uniref:DUF934 domain-containing protein n=1 Tax=Tianweitania sp. TaxID=2021634 RepID=UPI002898DF40|nr:DUF934 domain-containing protein [Tianweitania sp.]
MTDTTSPEKPAWRLWTPRGFRDDDTWIHGDDVGAADDTNTGVILPLLTFLNLDEERRASLRGRLGVSVQPGEPLDDLVPFLPDLKLVALSFPAFSDGRSFSKAELLRARYDFEGVLRATGDVLIDQVPHMLRLGFTEFEVSNPTALKRLAEGRVGGIEQRYQPAVTPEEKGAGYSWRRVAPASNRT